MERDGKEIWAEGETLDEFNSLVSVLLGTHLHPCHPLLVLEEEKNSPRSSAGGLAPTAKLSYSLSY